MSDNNTNPVLCTIQGQIALLTLNQPHILNAINEDLLSALNTYLAQLEANSQIKVIVLTGHGRAFAAGADLRQFKGQKWPDTYVQDIITTSWQRLQECRLPIIAAVNGLALGGGCELAMMCDMIIASETASFGQPEILLGLMPGAGGTQRLTRLVGQSMAMDMCLTGRRLSAHDALNAGLASRVFPEEGFLEQVIDIANNMATLPLSALLATKEAIKSTQDMPLNAGLTHERRLFQALLPTATAQEGINAFLEKRKPDFSK